MKWDQIGQFLQVRGKILNKKLAQIFADFGAILKSSLLSKNCGGYILGNFLSKFQHLVTLTVSQFLALPSFLFLC